MIARLLISRSPTLIKEEISKILASQFSHSSSGSLNHIYHPDLLCYQPVSKLGIAEARKIKEHFSIKPYSANGRVVVLEDASTLTLEAQNALLKTMEELPVKGLLLMGAQSDALFLPTVLSRCEVIRLQDRVDNKPIYNKEVEELLSATIEKRFEFVEKLKDKREEFLHSLVLFFHQNLRSHIGKGNSDYQTFLKELLQAEQWAKQNVNIRAILEYLMLVMPQRL